MGASTFINCVKKTETIKSALQAFTQEAEQSRREHGRSYSGEIGMKHDLRRVAHVPCASMKEAQELANTLLMTDDCGDKYGPALYLEVIGEEEVGWVFFGWAAS